MEEQKIKKIELIKISDSIYEISKKYREDMRVPARVFIDEAMLEDIMEDKSLWQLVNVATLPGIKKYALAMPDIHQGYGFPIGGVAAMAIDEGGVISPGGIGYDINCGVRLLTTTISHEEIKPHLRQLAKKLFDAVPSGVGRGGRIKLTREQLDEILTYGAQKMVEMGYGNKEDIEFCESNGRLEQADACKVSDKAKHRGADQVGTLGSGNHFLELQVIDEIYDEAAAHAFGLRKGMITAMIHCGSRGLGHQTCTEYVRVMIDKLQDWNITLPDLELACAPFNSPEGQDYFAAMSAAANFAWANRHVIGHWIRTCFQEVLGTHISVKTMYDVCHNIGKVEPHSIDGKETNLIVHRKGATRAFGPGHPEMPLSYQPVGQPVLIPGTMGTSSYVLAGTQEGMNVAFGSSCHGAGRRMSRVRAKKMVRGSDLRKELQARGIIIESDSNQGLAEEAPIAYKDVDNVVNVIQDAKIARKVVRLKPIAVIKGG